MWEPDEKSLHEEELGQPAREQHAGGGTRAGVDGDRRRGGGPATVLAPMAGVTDTVFRRFIRNASIFTGTRVRRTASRTWWKRPSAISNPAAG